MINITFGQKTGKQGKPFASLGLVLLPTKLTKPLVWSNVALEWRGLFCTADLHAHFFSPPLSPPRTEHCGGRRQEQLGLFRGKSSSSSMRRSRLPYSLHPPLLSSHQHQKQTPPPETTTSSTRFTSTSTNIKPSVTSSCL